MRGIYWDNGTQQWYESSDAESLFNWTADDVTDLSNAITDKSLFAVDINDDKYDDLTFYASTKGQGSSFANELWLGTVLSAKQEGGPNLFNADSASLQKHPVAKDWSQVTIAIPGKFDGDDLDDIVFVQTGSPGKIYVARAKAEDM